MIITVNSQDLGAQLRQIKNVVPTKPAIAILSHALLRAEGSTLHLYATDLEIGLSTDCPAQVDAPGEVCLPVAKFLNLVEQFPDADVGISLDKAAVVVRCGAFKSRLQALSPKDFPQPPAVEGPTITLDAAGFRAMIARTRPAVNTNAAKYIMKGALLTVAGPVAAMVATDGKRLVLTTMAVAEGADQRIVIPAKALDVLASQADGGDIEVTIGQLLSFAVGGKVITSRTIDGEFPKYERIIPRDNEKVVTIDRSALTAALKRVMVAADANGAVYFSIAPGTMELSSASAEVGSASEPLAVGYDGAPLKVCIAGGYVLDFLNVASRQAITMALKDPNSAALFTDGDDHVCVVMLMRTN